MILVQKGLGQWFLNGDGFALPHGIGKAWRHL